MVAYDDTETTLFSTYFGTRSPCWTLNADSDALRLCGNGDVTVLATPLPEDLAKQVRQMSGITQALNIEVTLFGELLSLLLVGRKIDSQAWGGTAVQRGNVGETQRALEAGLTFAEQVVSEVNSLVVVLDHEGKIKRFNRLCEEVTGYSEEQVVGRNAVDMFVDCSQRESSKAGIESFFNGEITFETIRPIVTKNGPRMIQWRNKIIESGCGATEKYMVCSGTDITMELRAEKRLVELANTDTLTGLPNRYSIESTIRELTRVGSPFGMLFLDLDNFKNINDHYGHITGDALLKKVGESLTACVAPGDTVARLGGDEFLVIVCTDQRQDIEMAAKRILEMLAHSVKLERAEIYSSCSMGISLFPDHGTTIEELVRRADTAMYSAKDECKGTFRVFSPEMENKISEYVWLDSNLRKGLEAGEFELYYQPKISLISGAVESVEALLRWNHPVRGLVSPDEFIPYAEQSGLIVALGKWVMQAGARQAGIWKKAGLNLRVAINVSARQLKDPELLENYTKAVLTNDLTPALLDLELTESCFIDDEQLAHRLIRMFRELGAQVHLDDFGTGYSSLSQLARLPLDVLKLDGTFIASINTDSKSRALVRSMVAVGHELNLKIVAECVETQEQAEFLRRIGVDYAQGYLYGKPMSLKAFDSWRTTQSVPTLSLVA